MTTQCGLIDNLSLKLTPQYAWVKLNLNFKLFKFVSSVYFRFSPTGIEGGNVLDNVNDICASFQYSFVNHLVRKTQLGFKFAELTKRIPPENKTLVVSGGVASNQFLRDSFKILCEAEGYRLLIPPPKLCTDNGVMIAWNGIEKWNMGLDILRTEKEITSISIENKCTLGPNLTEECRAMKIPKFKYVKLV
ncbi:putative tRNA N6-adenosine threonylcarbamoyltransferase, mitochondrial [Armadillidium vulgare]|nr:putative tRNA N6-adenosine threonylcarbamoyltransferase, mitochondrial [Armadillidium vulgare]